MHYEIGNEPDTWHRFRLVAFGIIVLGWMLYAGACAHIGGSHLMPQP